MKKEVMSLVKQNDTAFFSYMLEDMEEGILVIGPKGTLHYCNGRAKKLLELEEEPTGSVLARFQQNSANDVFTDCILDAVYKKALHQRETVHYTDSTGRQFYLQLTTSYMHSGESGGEVIVTLADITEMEVFRRKGRDHILMLTTLMLVLCFWNLVYSVWNTMGQPISDKILTIAVEVIGFILLAFILKTTSLRLSDMGVGFQNMKSTMGRAALISLAVAVTMVVVKVVMLKVTPDFFSAGAPFFDFHRIRGVVFGYFFTAIVQEFISRGIIQSALTRVYEGKYSDVLSIIITSMFFAALHVYKGLAMCIGAAVMSVLLGILYRKDRNIWGISLIHYTVGLVPNLLGVVS